MSYHTRTSDQRHWDQGHNWGREFPSPQFPGNSQNEFPSFPSSPGNFGFLSSPVPQSPGFPSSRCEECSVYQFVSIEFGLGLGREERPELLICLQRTAFISLLVCRPASALHCNAERAAAMPGLGMRAFLEPDPQIVRGGYNMVGYQEQNIFRARCVAL